MRYQIFPMAYSVRRVFPGQAEICMVCFPFRGLRDAGTGNPVTQLDAHGVLLQNLSLKPDRDLLQRNRHTGLRQSLFHHMR